MATPAAKGLFHKAIIQSGSIPQMGMTLPVSKTTRRLAELTLQYLGLDPSKVDQLQKIPYSQLNEAGEKALKKAGEEEGVKGLFGRMGLMWLLLWMETIFLCSRLDPPLLLYPKTFP